jgi:hypothetical protein
VAAVALKTAVLVGFLGDQVAGVAHGLALQVPTTSEAQAQQVKALLAVQPETQAAAAVVVVRLLVIILAELLALMVALALYRVLLAQPLTTLVVEVVEVKGQVEVVAQVVVVMAQTLEQGRLALQTEAAAAVELGETEM